MTGSVASCRQARAVSAWAASRWVTASVTLALAGMTAVQAAGPNELFVRGRVEQALPPHDAVGQLVLKDGALGPVVAVLQDPGDRIRRILPTAIAFRGTIQAERSADDLPVLVVTEVAPGPWHGLHDAIWASASAPSTYRDFRSIPSPPRRILPEDALSHQRRDSDGDGVPDFFELAHGSDPDSPDAGADRDRDGRSLLEEFVAGTDPDDPHDALRVGEVEASRDGIVLHWRSVVGRTYRVVVSDALSAPFSPLPETEMTATSETSSVIIPVLPGTPHAFFSVEVMLPE